MFDFLRSKKSLVRRRLQEHPWVRRTWFEWSFEDGVRTATLIVEMDVETDPNGSYFRSDDLDEIGRIVQETTTEQPIPNLRFRLIPRMHQH